MSTLPLYDLEARHIGLTQNIAGSYVEAARVCLDRHHESPIDFIIESDASTITANTEWVQATDRERAAWNNEIDTTEAGAYACALAALELSDNLYAVRRAETLTGADYYVAPADYAFEDLEHCYRFEVSGTNKGAESDVSYRLQKKIEQASSGTSNLPALAGVVGFKIRLIKLQKVAE